MEMKTQLDTLVSLRNEQLEVVLNRKASVRMLEKMDPTMILVEKMDMTTMQPVKVTAEARLKEMSSALVHDQNRLDVLEEMIKEQTPETTQSSSQESE